VDSIQIANSRFCRQGVTDKEDEGGPATARLTRRVGLAQWTQQVYFQLLDCGSASRPRPAAARASHPIAGYNRVYVHLDGAFSYEKWWKGCGPGRPWSPTAAGPPDSRGRYPATCSRARKARSWNWNSA